MGYKLRCALGDLGVRAWAEALILTVFFFGGMASTIIGGGSPDAWVKPIREPRSSGDH